MPHDDDKPADADSAAKEIIRRKAGCLMRRGGFSPSDLPDLEQELWMHLLKKMPTFDSGKAGWAAFVTAVVTAWGANLLRARFAARRHPRRLHPPLPGTEGGQQEGGSLGERLGEKAHDVRLGRHHPPEQERLELQLDVREALERLPDDLRHIAERLRQLSIAELARELGMPRTTLCELIARIRRRFQRMGLGKNG